MNPYDRSSEGDISAASPTPVAAAKARSAKTTADKVTEDQPPVEFGKTPLRTATPDKMRSMNTLAAAIRAAEEEERSRSQVSAPPEPPKKAPRKNVPGVLFYTNTPFDNEEVHASIDERVGALDIGDLVMHGACEQHVPIIPGKLEVVFTSLRGRSIEWIEQRAGKLAADLPPADVNGWVAFATLAFGLKRVNSNTFRDLQDLQMSLSAEEFEREVEAKIRAIKDMEETFVSVLMVNWTWFRLRVHQLYGNAIGEIKNG